MIDTDPIYADNRVTGRDIVVYAGSTSEKTSGVTVECFRVPIRVEWGYVVVNEEAVYDPGSSTNFQLHHSEQPDLVIKILTMAGISTEDAALFSAAKGEEQLNLQQENK